MALHIFNTQAQFKSKLALIQTSLTRDDAVLLIEDAVYASQKFRKELKAHVYTLEEDCLARAIVDNIDRSNSMIDYAGFVELTEIHQHIISW